MQEQIKQLPQVYEPYNSSWYEFLGAAALSSVMYKKYYHSKNPMHNEYHDRGKVLKPFFITISNAPMMLYYAHNLYEIYSQKPAIAQLTQPITLEDGLGNQIKVQPCVETTNFEKYCVAGMVHYITFTACYSALAAFDNNAITQLSLEIASLISFSSVCYYKIADLCSDDVVPISYEIIMPTDHES